MERRKFISFLAGIVAIPAGISALFHKQDLSIDCSKIDYVYIEERHPIEGKTVIFDNKFWVLGRDRTDFLSYNDSFDDMMLEAISTGGK